jgi:hypothetical protein
MQVVLSRDSILPIISGTFQLSKKPILN